MGNWVGGYPLLWFLDGALVLLYFTLIAIIIIIIIITIRYSVIP